MTEEAETGDMWPQTRKPGANRRPGRPTARCPGRGSPWASALPFWHQLGGT